MNEFIPVVEHLGALGILALGVWKLPSIIDRAKEFLNLSITHVREAHTEATKTASADLNRTLEIIAKHNDVVERQAEEKLDLQRQQGEELKVIGTTLITMGGELKALANNVDLLNHEVGKIKADKE